MSIVPGTEYTLTVNIPEQKDRDYLKEHGYYFSISKQTGDTHNVVWAALNDFKPTVTTSWNETYQVYATQNFQAGAVVKATSNTEEIEFGQTCTLDSNGVMGNATGTPDSSGKFYVDNKFGATSLGLSCKVDTVGFLPIYVSPLVVSGTIALEAKTIVYVWLALKQTTFGLMYDKTESPAFQVEYSGGHKDITITYKDGKWSKN